MSKVLVTEQHLQDIASAIRAKLDSEDTYRPGDMAAAIGEISGYPEPTGTVTISQNGTANVKDYAAAAVNVQPVLQQKTATQNGTVTPDSGYDGLSSVDVNVGAGERLYLVSPDELDAYTSSNYKEGGLPVSCVMNRYGSTYTYGVGTTSFDGTTKNCFFRNSQDLCSVFFCKKIPANQYAKLYIKCKVAASNNAQQRTEVGFKSSIAFNSDDGWISFDKRIFLSHSNMTAEQLQSQEGVVLNTSSNTNLPEQVVVIDIPADVDLYFAIINWWSNFYIREIYAEAAPA